MKKDELILFPAIRRGEVLGIEQPITVMRADHAAHGRRVAEIQRMTANLALPNGACGTWTRLCDGLAEFTDDLTEPMRLENEVLFSQFEPAGHADA
jgi:regulator of cell morphogenesis and NO signaling